MIPCLYPANEMLYQNNGIGKLADAQKCRVTEKRNGSYELKMIYPAGGIHADYLEEGNIILAKPADQMRSQPFRIYKITTPLSGKLEIQARHVSYQLNFISVSPTSAASCKDALTALKQSATTECPFEFQTDIQSEASFHVGVPQSLRGSLGGIEGSVLDTYGGEFEWNRNTVILQKNRGRDNGVKIVYGKNLIDFKMEKNIENVITGVHPYWKDSETGEVMELPEKVLVIGRATEPYQKIHVLDCTGGFEERPTEEQLRNYAASYLKSTSLTEPSVDIDIDFAQLWQTPGYEDIAEAERVSLCDTVHVYIMKLGIEVSSKVTETEYDSLLERYVSITLSNSSVSSRNTSLTASLGSIRSEAANAVQAVSRVETAVTDVAAVVENQNYYNVLATALFGLHYFTGTDAQGRTVRYACNHSTLAESTVAYRYGVDGYFYSTDGGQSWNYGWNNDQTAAMNAIQLPQILRILDGRYEIAKKISEALQQELDRRYEIAQKLSAELWKDLDDKYAGAAGELSPDLIGLLDERYQTASGLSDELWQSLDARYADIHSLGDDLLQTLDERYKVAAESLTDALWETLDEKYATANALTEDLIRTLDIRFETAKKLSAELWNDLDNRYTGAADDLTPELQQYLDQRYQTAGTLSEELMTTLDGRYQNQTATALSDALWEELDRRYGSHNPDPDELDGE